MGFIYKLINSINDMAYIGATNRSPKERFKHHRFDAKHHRTNMILHKAMDEIGCDKFTLETIEITDDLENRERYWIEYYNTIYPNGYNQLQGGVYHFGDENPFYNKKHTPETKKMLSEISKERFELPENNPFFGKHHTEETKKLISDKNTGKTRSDRLKKEQSIRNSGENNPFFGKKHSNETKKHLSNTRELKNIIGTNIITKETIFFDGMMSAYDYLYNNNFCKKETLRKNICGFILKCIKENKCCYGFYWKIATEDEIERYKNNAD